MSNILMPSIKELNYKIKVALMWLCKNDHFLIENFANESSITHKFAEYTQFPFPEWNVDCKYNRDGNDIKRLEAIEECSKQKRTDRIVPDIIVHHRCTNENLLVIEVKVREDDAWDRKKLELLTKKDSKHGYAWGLFIKLNISGKQHLTWYKEDKEYSER